MLLDLRVTLNNNSGEKYHFDVLCFSITTITQKRKTKTMTDVGYQRFPNSVFNAPPLLVLIRKGNFNLSDSVDCQNAGFSECLHACS